MNGQKTLKCEHTGTVFFFTPALERNRDTTAQPLMDQGFEKVALPEVPIFNPASTANFCTPSSKKTAPLAKPSSSANGPCRFSSHEILRRTSRPLLLAPLATLHAAQGSNA